MTKVDYDLFRPRVLRSLREECQFLGWSLLPPLFPILYHSYIGVVDSSLENFDIEQKISCGAGSQWLDKNNSPWFLFFLICCTGVIVETIISTEIIYFNFIWIKGSHCCSLSYWNLRYISVQLKVHLKVHDLCSFPLRKCVAEIQEMNDRMKIGVLWSLRL